MEHLYKACEQNNEETARIILSYSTIPKRSGELSLNNACWEGNVGLLRALRDSIEVDTADSTHYLRGAICSRRLEAVRVLLSYTQINPGHEGSAALRIAVREDCLDIVQLLLEDGRSDIYASGALDEAWSRSNRAALQLLLSHSSVREETRREYDPDRLYRGWTIAACVGIGALVAYKLTR